MKIDDKMRAEESFLASAIQWLIEGGSKDDLLAASLLMACKLDFEFVEHGFSLSSDESFDVVRVRLTGPRQAVEEINDQEETEATAFDDEYHQGRKKKPTLGKRIAQTFSAISPPFENLVIQRVYAQGGLSEEITPEWWSSVREYLKTGGVTNQGWYRPDEVKGSTPVVWKALRFRSVTEKKIAEALEAANAGIYHIRRIWDMAPKLRLHRQEAVSISDLIRAILDHRSVLQVANPMREFVLVSHLRRMW